MGLQFFSDRPAAMREMYRVLVSGGRLGLMVWQGIEYAPGFSALAAALGRHVSSEAADIMRAPFALAGVRPSSRTCGEPTIDQGAGPCRSKAMARHRIHSLAFKKQVVQEYAAGATLNALAR